MANHEVDVTNHEPTIDELVNFVIAMEQNLASTAPQDTRLYASRAILKAIRTILEQHKEHNPSECGVCLGFSEIREHNAIRAFVTRVGAKYTVEHPTIVVPEFMQPWWDALEELEKESTDNE